jgi:dTDP-4-dehydrorhamnose reductase
MTVSPTYVPDLVNACLDLLIDKESGIWHLSNGAAMSWADLARRACEAAGIDSSRLEARPAFDLGMAAARPLNSALGSERGLILPAFNDALARYLRERELGAPRAGNKETAHYAS